jgi:hypothetical protein
MDLLKLVDIPDQEYHATSAISAHKLMKALRSYEHTQTDFEETEAMLLGKAIHLACLQPDIFASQVAIIPKIDRRSKAGKAEYEAFQAEHQGKILLSEEQMQTILGVKIRFDLLRAQNQDLSLALDGAQFEQSLFWKFDDNLCKCRFDAVNLTKATPIIIDLKSAKDAHPESFKYAFKNFHYDLQAEWYCWGLSQILDPNFGNTRYLIVAIEKEPPFAGAVYEVNFQYCKGFEKILLALKNFIYQKSSYQPEKTWELF